jgi:hypothetical protein
MSFEKWISRQEEAELPEFKSHDEARAYFKEKYGDAFQLSDSDVIDGRKIYFYMYIVDWDRFNKMQEYMRKQNSRLLNAADPETNGFIDSYQSVQIWEDGEIHIVH